MLLDSMMPCWPAASPAGGDGVPGWGRRIVGAWQKSEPYLYIHYLPGDDVE
ncbi:hypothetical protein [Arthrobacter sp. MMS18-M83]|uniref:hypothetical protein n=1 Tax=Arthrobacter sp. MMS18-M83 TaxID=2996261 RepID=UPI00227C0169|nr:hypothetical protein [Arthrobacter sp. MMS18-M83]WAH98679.1 hypothetical protein OW521_07520 [Arthrobacter sp. MMS18-M83]